MTACTARRSSRPSLAMSRSEICPTCGTKLGPTHPRAAMRVCTSCQRSNPEGFSYCGFCASPMENTEMRARMTELAAPPGGWPNITSELVEVRFYLQHIRRLQHLGEQLPAVNIPVPKLKQFRAMARALDASELAELSPTKRYALATIFIRSQYAKTLDDAADLFIRLFQNLENAAQQKLLAYQIEHAKRADALIGQLKDVLEAYQLDGTDTQRVDAIGGTLIADVATLLAECEEHMAYAGRIYLPFLLQPYATARPLLLNCLEIMGLRSTSQDTGMVRMIEVLLSLCQATPSFTHYGDTQIYAPRVWLRISCGRCRAWLRGL